MTVAFIECYAGASGDMFLGAWLDLGVDEQTWRQMLSGLHVDGYEIHVNPVFKNGIRATKVDVNVRDQQPHYDGEQHDHGHDHGHEHNHEHDESAHSHSDHHHPHVHPHRHLADIQHILHHSQLPEPVLRKSYDAFHALAVAEGQVHGMSPDEVHFHEVGAVDAIVDIVGAMAGWYLAGMPECYVSAIEVGSGTVHCDHGIMPVPAPATATLIQGLETYSSGERGEMLTPTGAAILKTLCTSGRRPQMVTRKAGYGAGTKNFAVANVLRIQFGEVLEGNPTGASSPGSQSASDSQYAHDCASAMNTERACVIEANIDDMNPEWSAHTVQRLLELGAMDAWMSPVVMKKGRSGIQLHVLCAVEMRDKLIRQIHLETTSIGVRYYEVSRSVLPRDVVEVQTQYGIIRVKIASLDGRVVNVAPEYEDCRLRSAEHHVPLKETYLAAMQQYRSQG
jgi:pyridinium-3,5-bisthiocarboxylic acid mononucleotide nickel chelatase